MYPKTTLWGILLAIGLIFPQLLRGQAADEAISAILFHDLTAGVCENKTVNILGTHGLSADVAPACNASTGTIFEDSWFNVRSNLTGLLAFSVTPNAGRNIAIAVYDGASSSANLLNCTNLYTGTNLSTETVLISAVVGNTYTVRLMNLTANEGADYSAKLSVYPGPVSPRDLCVNAVSVSIGTCDFPFSVENGFIHNENNSTSIGGNSILADGWLKLDLEQNKRVRVEYANTNKNASIQVYRATTVVGGDCGNLTLITEINAVGGFASPEYLEFNATLAGTNTYFIRIGNLEDTESMAGEVCIEEVIARDECGDVQTHPASLALGDCGVRVSVLPTFGFSNADDMSAGSPTCDLQTVVNVWVKYTATSTTRVRLEFSSEGGVPIALAVSSGTICGSMSAISLSECLVATGSDSQALSFNVTSGTTYYIELGSDNPIFGNNFVGYLCLYEDAKKSEDVYYAANVLDATGQDCGAIFNISSTFEAKGDRASLVFLEPLAGCSGSLDSRADAWGSFQIATGALPSTGMLVEFDNNDGRNTVTAVDAALQVYKGGTLQTATDVDDNTCALAVAASTTINVNTFVTSLDINNNGTYAGTATCGVSGRQKWIRYQHTLGAKTVRVSFKSNSTQNFAVGVFSGCHTEIACGVKGNSTNHEQGFSDLATVTFNATNGVYYIRVVASNTITPSATVTTSLSVSIQDQLTLLGCSNNVVEGNESILLSGASFTDNTQYYFRIARIVEPTSGQKTVTGRACLRNNSIPQGDLCSNSLGLLVGDCDIQFNLTGDGGGEDRFTNNQAVANPTGGCNPGSTYRDGWISFTATTSSTTVEYTQTSSATQNVSLEVYRGSCVALTRLNKAGTTSSCANDFITGVAGVEKFTIATIPGIIYYVRVINQGFNNNLEGKFCVYNTVGRDACIDGSLSTYNVGDCNLTIDVPTTFDNDVYPSALAPLLRNFVSNLPLVQTGGSLIQYVQSSCETQHPLYDGTDTNPGVTSSRDAWFRLVGNGNEVTLNFTTTGGTANPAISVYTALQSVGPVNCGTGLSGANNPNNQYACANNITSNAPQTESVTFRTNGGQQYLVRIINLNGLANLTGSLCISDGRNNYDNPCTLSATGPRNVAIGSCSVPMNVIDTNVDTCYDPANSSANYDSGSTCDNCVNRDTWAVITRPYVCDLTVAVPTPNTAVVGGTTLISCIAPFRVNVGTDGAVGGTGTAADVCECGSNATNNCTPPAISSSPVAGVGCTCAVGYVCQNNVETGFTDRCVPAGYVYSRGLDATYNTLDDTYVPIITGGVCPRPYSLDLGSDNALGGTGTAADKCVCAQNTIRPNHPNNFTIEYDTRNGVSDVAANAGLVVYQTTDCGDENAFTQLACKDVIPAGTEGIETHNITGLPMTHGSGNETYYVRILNKTVGKTLIGSMCVYYGTDISNENCTFPLNDYGELEGEFKNFTIGHDGTNAPTGESLPSTTIPNCVSPGGSNPTSNGTFPIRSDAWMQFTVPVGANYSSVTVQFDNTGFLPARNAAIAIYTSPEIPTGTSWVRDGGQTNLTLNCNAYGASNPVSTANPNRGGLFLLDCQNAVFIGAETATINTTYSNGAEPSSLPINKARTYYVRVMNVHNENIPSTLVGRIRVFPAATCNLGSELVYDGDFAQWPALSYPSGTPDNMATPNTTNGINDYYAKRDAAVIRIPNISTNDPYPNDIDGVFGASAGTTLNTGVARFATDYGYLRENGTYAADNQTITFAQARTAGNGEFGPEGLYVVRHSPWTLKQNWFCFGVGYSGYGGRNPDSNGEPQAAYCTSGTLGAGSEACQSVSLENGLVTTVGTFNTTHTADASATTGVPFSPFDSTVDGLPAVQPSVSQANFMIINGSYNPAGNLPPGKLWCQTVSRASTDINDVSYYLFSVWVQNMKQIGSNSDVPQLRLTACDMEDPNNPGSLPTERDIYTTANGDPGNLDGNATNNARMTRLPGITDVTITDNTASVTNGNFTNANSSSGIGRLEGESLAQRVRHLPRPGNNRRFALVSAGIRPPSYGAAMSCNLSQNNGWSGAEDVAENQNARLKVLGASFLVPESPDNWVLIRCVYRAPRFVKEMNLCIENLSLTKNGNDFGVDGISFRKCDTADAETFDRLLKGDPCALSTDGKVTGIPLTANLIDFSANLMGDKVAVLWTTVGEGATSHYQVQRSIDGTNFIGIGAVDAKNVVGHANYEFIDSNLPVGVKQLFYRLIIVNKDGLEKRGSVVLVEIPSIEAFDLKLKPNPVSRGGEFSLGYHALQAGQASIVITDMLGNRLRKQLVTLQEGNGEIVMKTGNLQAGLYIVQMVQGTKIGTKKLVIQ